MIIFPKQAGLVVGVHSFSEISFVGLGHHYSVQRLFVAVESGGRGEGRDMYCRQGQVQSLARGGHFGYGKTHLEAYSGLMPTHEVGKQAVLILEIAVERGMLRT